MPYSSVLRGTADISNCCKLILRSRCTLIPTLADLIDVKDFVNDLNTLHHDDDVSDNE